MDWARICVDTNDRGDVLGYSIEVHVKGELDAVFVFPNGPFDSPVATLATCIEWLRARYGEQLQLAVF